ELLAATRRAARCGVRVGVQIGVGCTHQTGNADEAGSVHRDATTRRWYSGKDQRPATNRARLDIQFHRCQLSREHIRHVGCCCVQDPAPEGRGRSAGSRDVSRYPAGGTGSRGAIAKRIEISTIGITQVQTAKQLYLRAYTTPVIHLVIAVLVAPEAER